MRKIVGALWIAIAAGSNVAEAQWIQCANQATGVTTCTTAAAGVGTTNPAAKLDVVLSSGTEIARFRGIDGTAGAYLSLMDSTISATRGFVGYGPTLFTGLAVSDFGLRSAAGLALATNGGYVREYIDPTGNVGVGTTNPSAKLDVNGTLRAANSANPSSGAGLELAYAAGQGYVFAYDRDASAPKNLLLAHAGGNVGIGTTTVYGTVEISHLNPFNEGETSATTPRNLVIFTNAAGGRSALRSTHSVGSLYDGDMQLLTQWFDGTNYVWKERLRVRSDGRIGVGTPTPSASLDVNGGANVSGDITVSGNIRVGGNINAKYQDVAEWVNADAPMDQATVVSLDPDHDNSVVPNTRAYDPSVAGVVSARPGIVLGEPGTTKVLVATTGRVRVKVDATNNPIRRGDLLVTSDIPGVAMKSEPLRIGGRSFHQPGTIIGKALEPLASGRGEILVLLTLQ